MDNNPENITFLLIGLVVTISIWIVYAFVMSNEWEFAGITLLLNGLCYLGHRIINKNNNEG